MNRREQPRQQLSSIIVWLLLAFVMVLAAAFLALGVWIWQETRRVQALQAEVEIARREHQAAEAQVLVFQNTTSALEDRLTALEANDLGQQVAALQAALETAGEPQQIADLRASLAGIQTEVDRLQTSLNHLGTRMNALEAENALPPETRLTVARQRQSHNLSCESSAASMTAQYHGVDLSEAQVLAALPLNNNPNLGFRGNVDGPTGGIQDYGVYAGPILEVLNGQGLRARPVDGGLDGIKAAIARGNPVIAWVTYDCNPSTPTKTEIDGKMVTLVPWQHVVVVTGYSDEGVWANDPWDGKSDYYSTADFERAMGYFGNMAIEVAGP
jgi:uncharacterized protein YvpB/uncharacterized protein YoxC